jgi:hypothetical protein
MDCAAGPDTIVIPIGTADIEATTAAVTTALLTMDMGTTAEAIMDVVIAGIAGGATRVHE